MKFILLHFISIRVIAFPYQILNCNPIELNNEQLVRLLDEIAKGFNNNLPALSHERCYMGKGIVALESLESVYNKNEYIVI